MLIDEVIEYEALFRKGQIIDGLVDPFRYQEAKFKIAWFLKEAYTDNEDGFHIKDYYGGEDAYEDFFKNIATPTWHPITYVSYAILNEFLEWDDMDYIRNKPEMVDVVSSIAIINANKSASKTGTYTLHKNLVAGFNESKFIIEHQLRVLKPEIHIFGGTFFLYKEYFNLNDNCRVYNNPVIGVWKKDNKLYLDVYHPSNRSIKREEYINTIVQSVKKWSNGDI